MYNMGTRKKSKLGMDEKIESLVKNQTWDWVELRVGKRYLHNKWVYKGEGGSWRQEVVQG